MGHRIRSTALTTKGAPLNDAKREAATRCLSILQACALAAPVIHRQFAEPYSKIFSEAENKSFDDASALVVTALLDYGKTLASDLNALASLAGCQMIFVDPNERVH